MPYTHREVGDKECVYKKGTGKKVGCTTGDVDDYLGALHANVKTEELEELNESLIAVGRDKMFAAIINIKDSIKNNAVNTSDAVKTIIKSIKTGEELTKEQKIKIGNDLKTLLKSLGYGAVFMLPGGSVFIITFNLIKKLMDKKKLNESNKLKGGKADKMTPKKIANKFDVDVKGVKKQIEYGTCVECEHTDDKEKAKEIATDHVSEFPDYYNRLDKMEKQAEKHWGKKEKTNESKSLIKKLLRENLEDKNIQQLIQKELQRLGLPSDTQVYISGEPISCNKPMNEGLKNSLAKGVVMCGLAAGIFSCKKQNG